MTQSAVSRFEANAKRKIVRAKTQLSLLERFGIEVNDDDMEQRLRKLQSATKQGVKR
jgi:hypothetical protein